MDQLEHPFSEVRVYTPQPIDSDVKLPACAKNVVLTAPVSNAVWEQFVLPAAHGGKNVLLCPSYVLPVLATCPTVLIHHGSYEGYPGSFSWWAVNKARAVYTASAWRASIVSTVSECSKRDMVRFYGLKPERIHVISEGVDTDLFRPMRDPHRLSDFRRQTFGTDVPFIVYVGKPTERRNLTPFIRAFAQLKKQKKIPHKLLLAGTSLPGNAPYQKVISECGLKDEVVALGYVNHDDMVLTYNAADLLAYPSSYEGFGMPVLEAMACGTPVLALDNTVPAEFAQGVALLVKDANADTLVKGIETALSDQALRECIAVKGPQRAAAYDWRLVTKRYLDLIKPLVGG
jgi:glycosyltransferase involved in cell wall biosynthesis